MTSYASCEDEIDAFEGETSDLSMKKPAEKEVRLQPEEVVERRQAVDGDQRDVPVRCQNFGHPVSTNFVRRAVENVDNPESAQTGSANVASDGSGQILWRQNSIDGPDDVAVVKAVVHVDQDDPDFAATELLGQNDPANRLKEDN